MIVCTSIKEIQQILSGYRDSGKLIGFVPTMGALHSGHISLLETANKECDCSVVSIFVNPTQFNDKEDFKLYPRNVNKDLELLSKHSCKVVFLPAVEEIYPEPDERYFDFGLLEKVMEGSFRPGHFQGVAKVVSRLFDIVKPDNAYFGQKDFQQLAIIKKMVRLLSYKINIIGCPIVRESNGLAMSSRNQRLSENEFEKAAIIFSVLSQVPSLLKSKPLFEIKQWLFKTIDNEDGFNTEYVEFVDSDNLNIINNEISVSSITCCIAVFCGKVRLIDNIQIFL